MAYYLQSRVRGVGGQEYKGGGGCTKLPLHNAVCARFRYLYILSFPLLAFCTKMCYSRFKGDAVCACYYAGWCECIAHSKMAVGRLYRQPRCCCMTRLSWRKPFCCAHPPPPPHPPLTLPSPCTPFSATQLLDYHTPDCESLSATSHMATEWERQSYGDACRRERGKGEQYVSARRTHIRCCGTRPHPVFLIYAWR